MYYHLNVMRLSYHLNHHKYQQRELEEQVLEVLQIILVVQVALVEQDLLMDLVLVEVEEQLDP